MVRKCRFFGGSHSLLLLLVRVLFLLVISVGTHVELILDLVVDLGELLLLEKRKKVPSLIQGLEDSSVLVEALLNELSLESVVEKKVESILIGQSLLTDDGLHSLGILTLSVECVHLIGDLRMINSGETLTNSMLHESGERWQDIDRWINLSLMHVSINVDLSFGNISSKIGDRMGDIVIWHGQDRNLSD